MSAVLLIAGDSIRALLHQRLLVALMLVTLGLTILFSVLLTEAKEWFAQNLYSSAALDQDGPFDAENLNPMRIGMGMMGSFVMAVFYWFTALGGTVVTLFICASAVATDIRRGTIHIILAKPVSRAQNHLGKNSGAVAVMFGYSLLIGIALMLFAYANALNLNQAFRYAPWLMFCHNLMVGSVALLLSLLIHPLLAAVVAYFASASFLSVSNPLYFILPSYDCFYVFKLIMSGKLITPSDIALLTLYAFDVTAIFLLLALWRFHTKELL